MNDEIKEILDKIKNVANRETASRNALMEMKNTDYQLLLDYITNLQRRNDNLIEDFKRHVDRINELTERSDNLQQENERLKHQLNQEKPNYLQIWQLEDRIDKAVEDIKKDTRWFDSEYARVYGELCDCAGAKGDRLEVMVNPSNALNILQNGSDSR